MTDRIPPNSPQGTDAASRHDADDSLAVLANDALESSVLDARRRMDDGEITVAFQNVCNLIEGLVWIAKRNGLGDDPYVVRAEAMLRG